MKVTVSKITLSQQTLDRIINSATDQIAEDLKSFMESKSKNGFYAELAETIISNNDQVVGSSLTNKMLFERGLIDEFFQ